MRELFSAVPNRDLPKSQWNGIPVYGKSNLGIEVFVKPVIQETQLELHFPYPDEEELWQSKPGKYIAHLVGHEGPGSLLAYLKARGLGQRSQRRSVAALSWNRSFHLQFDFNRGGPQA